MIAVVYLVRDCPASHDRFVGSYIAHPAGIQHQLVFLCKGRNAQVPPRARGLNYIELRVSDFGQDLTAYLKAAKNLTHERLCFLNTHSEILKDGWLESLNDRMESAGTDMVASMVSMESLANNLIAELFFDSFPNLSPRTNGFLVKRETMLKVWPRWTFTKWACRIAESGRFSIKNRLKWTYVGGYSFRHDHSQLLFLDNQTRAYDDATPDEQARLRNLTWG